MANIAGSYDQAAEPSASMDAIPAGTYRAQVIESELADISKNRDIGGCLVLCWKIEGGEYNGRLLWQRLNMFATNAMNNHQKVIDIANQQFASIRHATGKLNVTDSTELHYIPCDIRVAVETDPNGQYAPSNKIKGVNKVGGNAATAPRSTGNAPTGTANPAAAKPTGSAPSFMQRKVQ